MALGPLSFLNIGARIAYPFIRLGVRLNRTLAQISGALSRAAVRVEVSAIRRVVAAERAQRAEISTVLGRRTDVVLDPADIPEAITRQRRRFAWRVRFGIIDRASGKVIDRYLTLSTDDLLSADEALEQATETLRREYSEQFEVLTDSEIVQVTQAAPGRRL